MVAKDYFWILLFLGALVANVVVYRILFAEPSISVIKLGAPTLITSPSGQQILIDTGPDASILRALGTTLTPWQRTLSAIVITNPSASANGGLTSVLSRYQVHEIIRADTLGTNAFEAGLAESRKVSNVPEVLVRRGDRILLGGGAYLDVLWPPETHSQLSSEAAPLVLQLSYGATSFLFKNDLSARTAAWMHTLNEAMGSPSVILSSSTPSGAFISNGREVRQQ